MELTRAWFKIACWLFEYIWADLSPSEQAVLPVVIAYASCNEEYICEVSIKTIVKAAGIYRQGVINALADLCDKRGLLFLEERGGNGRGNINRYRISPRLVTAPWLKIPRWIFVECQSGDKGVWATLFPSRKAVLPIVMMYANSYLPDKGECYATIETIARKAGTRRRITITALQDLDRQKLITRVMRGGLNRHRAVTYNVKPLLEPPFAKGAVDRPLSRPKGAQDGPLFRPKGAQDGPLFRPKGAQDGPLSENKRPNSDTERVRPVHPMLDKDIIDIRQTAVDNRQKGPARLPEERLIDYAKRFLSSNKPRADDI